MNCRRLLRFCFLAVLLEQVLSSPMIKTDNVTPGIEGTTVKGKVGDVTPITEAPTTESTTEDTPFKGITDKDGAVDYLRKYGYYRPEISKNSNSEKDELQESIKKMQTFLNLNVTGELDNETLALMNSKRCSLPDKVIGPNGRQKRYLAKAPWLSRYLTYNVLNYPSTTLYFNNNGDIDRAIDEGFKIWTKSANIFLTRSSSNVANLKMSFNKGYHGDEDPFYPNNQILAHAFYPTNGGIHFNDYYSWSQYDNYNLRQVTAHEVGHALGLGHSSDISAIMYPIIYYKTIFELSDDDIRGIQYLYGPVLPTTTTKTLTKTTLFRKIPQRCRLCYRLRSDQFWDMCDQMCFGYDF